jgi:PAS domain S-box-containing protein
MTIDKSSTPQEETSQELYEQRQWLRVTLSSIGDAVITTDGEGNVNFLNQVAQDLTAWTQAEAAGVPLDQVFNIVNEQTRLTVENPGARALREGVIVGLANHTILIAKDGTERPIDDSAAPIRNASGAVAGVVLVFRDITERRRNERVLHDSLTYAQSIIATLREPFCVLNSDLRVLTANRSFYDTFQVAPKDTENQFIYHLGDRQWDTPTLRALLEGVLGDHQPVDDFLVEHDFPAIGPKIMLLNARRFAAEATHQDLLLLSISDVTDQKQAEAAMRDSELRYRRLFESAQDAILILDADTSRIIDANPFILNLLGYRVQDLVGKELWELGLFRDIEANKIAFEELKRSGYLRYENLPLERADGHPIEVEFVSNVYQVGQSSVIQCNIRDITVRSRLERQTHDQAAALADLHQRKDEFLAMLSHELRNPLSAIFNALHILRLEDHQNPIQRKAKQVVERQVAQMARMVDDLLEVSRVLTGRIRLRTERLELTGILERSVESARGLFDRRRQDLSVSLSGEPIWVEGDPVRLEQVFVNLLSNAAKYTDEGGSINVSARRINGFATVSVRDTGAGIPPELLPRIFDLFTQADRTLDRSQGGLGIGLSLVHRIIELHGGSVAAHSAGIGKGSEFIIQLPVLRTTSEISLVPDEVKHNHGGSRILVVDDNQDAADMLVLTLQMLGHHVDAVYSGAEALTAVVEPKPDFVILDIGMPDLDGYEIARRIRRIPKLDDVWLIAVTGYGNDSDRQRTAAAGFDEHLVKPVVPEVLAGVLERLATLTRSATS